MRERTFTEAIVSANENGNVETRLIFKWIRGIHILRKMKFFIYGEVLNACQTHSKRWVMAFYRLSLKRTGASKKEELLV